MGLCKICGPLGSAFFSPRAKFKTILLEVKYEGKSIKKKP